jgi:uncharacterized protein YdeI (YjbR/CyaY-like superfamily)
MGYTITKHTNGMHIIRLTEADAKKITRQYGQRVICTVNKIVSFHAAILKTSEGWHYLNIGLDKMKKLGVKAGATVSLSITGDDSEFQFEMPEEFREVLDTDPDALEIFYSLRPGNQRGIIYLVSKLKSPDKRVEKSLHIAELLKAGITSPRDIASKKRS